MQDLRRQVMDQQRAIREQQETQLREQQRQRDDMARARAESMRQQLAQTQSRAMAGAGFAMGNMAHRAMQGGMAPTYGGREYISRLEGIERGYIAPALAGALNHINLGGLSSWLYPNVHHSLALGNRGQSFARARAGGTVGGIAETAYGNWLTRPLANLMDFNGKFLSEITQDDSKQFIERRLEFAGRDIIQRLGASTGDDGRLDPESSIIGQLVGNNNAELLAYRKRHNLVATDEVAKEYGTLRDIAYQSLLEQRGGLSEILLPINGLTGKELTRTQGESRKRLAQASQEEYFNIGGLLENAGEGLQLTAQGLHEMIGKLTGMGIATKDAAKTMSDLADTARAFSLSGPDELIETVLNRTQNGMQRGMTPTAAAQAATREFVAVQDALVTNKFDNRMFAYGRNEDEQASELLNRTSGIRNGQLASLLTFAGGDGSLQERLGRASQKLAADPLSYLREQSTDSFNKRVQEQGVSNVMSAFGSSGLPKELVWAAVGQQGGMGMQDARNTFDVFSAAVNKWDVLVTKMDASASRASHIKDEMRSGLVAAQASIDAANELARKAAAAVMDTVQFHSAW